MVSVYIAVSCLSLLLKEKKTKDKRLANDRITRRILPANAPRVPRILIEGLRERRRAKVTERKFC